MKSESVLFWVSVKAKGTTLKDAGTYKYNNEKHLEVYWKGRYKTRILEPISNQLATVRLPLHEILLIESRYALLKETLD